MIERPSVPPSLRPTAPQDTRRVVETGAPVRLRARWGGRTGIVRRLSPLAPLTSENPRLHGFAPCAGFPEIWAVSSTETVFEAFEINSRRRASGSTGFEPFGSLGLLHELLHEKARSSCRRVQKVVGGPGFEPGASRSRPCTVEPASKPGICTRGYRACKVGTIVAT